MRNVIGELLALERDAQGAARVEAPDRESVRAETARRVAAVELAGDARMAVLEKESAAELAAQLAQVAADFTRKAEMLEAAFSEARAAPVEEIVRGILFGDAEGGDAECAAG